MSFSQETWLVKGFLEWLPLGAAPLEGLTMTGLWTDEIKSRQTDTPGDILCFPSEHRKRNLFQKDAQNPTEVHIPKAS